MPNQNFRTKLSGWVSAKKLSLLRWWCELDGHELTCAAAEGIPPTEKQLADGLDGFYDYATVYCRRCGYVYELDRRKNTIGLKL